MMCQQIISLVSFCFLMRKIKKKTSNCSLTHPVVLLQPVRMCKYIYIENPQLSPSTYPVCLSDFVMIDIVIFCKVCTWIVIDL